jgi:siroheme synthase
MGMDNAEHISRELMKGGMDPDMPAAVISRGSTPEQKVAVTSVKDLAETISLQHLEQPGIIVIGTVARIRDSLGDLI